MNKQLTLAVATIMLSTNLNISQAVELSPAQVYVNQVKALQDPVKTAQAILGVEEKLAACQQLESEDCSYFGEVISLLSSVGAN